ncbi:MAG: hypothetical protein F9B45_09765 [Phycisphaera sp. RhM]|nr:hypothetical protein [Phycisphaera sp. RhM]
MIKNEVTPEHVSKFGPKDACGDCNRKIGQQHGTGCRAIRRTVVVKAETEFVIEIGAERSFEREHQWWNESPESMFSTFEHTLNKAAKTEWARRNLVEMQIDREASEADETRLLCLDLNNPNGEGAEGAKRISDLIRSIVMGGDAAESILNETLFGAEADAAVKALTEAKEAIGAAIEGLQVKS